MKSQRGEVVTILLLAIVAIGAGLVATKTLPIFNGESRRAKEGQATTAALVGSYDDRAAAQTASAVAIGESAVALPESRERSFMLNEVPIMLARGPAPDPKQLLAARDRRIAFLEGNLKAQREQTERALQDAEKLRSEIAEKTLEKKAADDAISTAAAEAIAANRTALGFGALAALALAAFVWVKLQAGGLTSALSKMVPVLDAHGTDSIYSELSKKFDATEKRLIHKVRAKLTK